MSFELRLVVGRFSVFVVSFTFAQPRKALPQHFDDTIERRQREIAEEHGFELVDHALVLYVRPKGSKVTRQEGAGPGKK